MVQSAHSLDYLALLILLVGYNGILLCALVGYNGILLCALYLILIVECCSTINSFIP